MANKTCPTLRAFIGEDDWRKWEEEFNALPPEEQERRKERNRAVLEERARIIRELIDGHGEPLREPTPYEEWYLKNH